MSNVYLALKKSVILILLFFCQAAFSQDIVSNDLGPVNLNKKAAAVADTPVIQSFSPKSGRKGTFVAIVGSKFTNTTAVRFGGVLADSLVYKSDSVIIAIVGNGATGSVSVTTPFGTASKPGFTFIRDSIPDTPVIQSFSPTSGRKGTLVVIVGSKFKNTSAVRFGGVLADSLVYKSDSVVIAIVGNGATGSVSVTTPFGTASKPGFTFIRDSIPDSTGAPVIQSFSPTSGRKGTLVTIVGSKFKNATAVRFGGVLADSLVYRSDSVILAIVGSGATGNVSVTTPFGTGSKPGFTFIKDTTSIPDTAAPVITSFTPTRGTVGTIVSIHGKHFKSATQVQFGTEPAASMTVLSDSIIIAQVDTGATGNVAVFTPFGTAYKPGFTFIPDTTGTDTLIINGRIGMYSNNTTAKPFTVYPNPASSNVIWQQPATDHNTRLQLIDMSGRVVRNMTVRSNATQATLQVAGLHAGVYKLVWSDGKKKMTRSLLVK